MLPTHQTVASARFAGVFQSQRDRADPYDRIIAEVDGNFLVPTLGSIVPNWLLAIPQSHSLNYRNYACETGKNPFRIAEMTAKLFGISLSEIIWFEHGASSPGSETGCGVDYAHLHILLSPAFAYPELCNAVFKSSNADWWQCCPFEVYQKMHARADYYVVGSGDNCMAHDSGQAMGSQFFRKRVAELIGRPTVWDYRVHPFCENISATLRLGSVVRKEAA